MSLPIDARPGTPGASPRPDQVSSGHNLGIPTEQAQSFNAIYADLESYFGLQLPSPIYRAVDYTLDVRAELELVWNIAETGIYELLEGKGIHIPSYAILGGSIPLPEPDSAFIRLSRGVQGRVIRFGFTLDGMPDDPASRDFGIEMSLAETDGSVGVFETKTDLDGTEEVLKEEKIQLSPDQLRNISKILKKYSPSGIEEAERPTDGEGESVVNPVPARELLEAGGIDPLQKEVVDITLDTSLEDIPDPEPCEVCGHPTKKKFIEHVVTGADLRIRAMRAAGYQCQDPECGISAYSIEAILESLTKASGILANSGDMATAAALDRRIEMERRRLIAPNPSGSANSGSPLGDGSEED